MSNVSTTSARPRGRPRQFDKDAVLDALVALFWLQGYEATSMSDIEKASGLNKSSLYNAFGSKHELFELVLDRYINLRIQTLASMLRVGEDGVAALHGFVDALRDEGRGGCLAVNTSAELGAGDEAVAGFGRQYREKMRAGIREVISAASAKSGLPAELVEARTDMFLTFMLGLAVAVRGGASDEEFERLIDSAHATVESWRR